MERWPRPSRKRAIERSDVHWQAVSLQLFNLRKLESAERVKDHAVLFNKILAILMKRKDFVTDADFWKELYLRSIWQLPNLTKIGPLPASVVVKHNHILSFYMRQLPKIPQEIPVLHWDTHTDGNAVADSAALPALYEKGTDAAIREAQEIVYDIGAAISGVIMATGPRDFIWAMPAWVPDPELHCRYWLSKGSKNISMVTQKPSTAPEAKALGTTSLSMSKRMPAGAQCATFAQILISKATGNARLLSMLPGDKYILDVDLDFFCSNGRPVDSTYDKDPYDVSSHHRIARRELVENPRDTYAKDTKEFKSYAKAVNKEMALIRARLAAFEATLKFIKRHGKRACLISISDSTDASITQCIDCASSCNSYTPHQLALYLRTKVIEIIKRVKVWEY
jgi:hypothetical protein